MHKLAVPLIAGVAISAGPAAAQAPTIYKLLVNDRAELPQADLICTAKQPNELVCGGRRSKLFIQFDRRYVTLLRLRADSSFRQVYRVRR
jgi:hypothetical protein